MADRIKNYSLGSAGVILDPHHLLPGVPAEGLTLAQNATHDPKRGFGGAIRKRPGFAIFNNEFAGGVIMGGIPMPVAGFGGAPAAGGGALIGTGDADDGTSVGTGDMSGQPGATFDGGSPFFPPAGANLFNGGSALFGGKRLIVVARLGSDTTSSNEGGSGWYISSKNLADTAVKVLTPGPPVSSYSFPAASPFLDTWGTPGCTLNGWFYYAGAHGNQVTGSASPIRKMNGASDVLVNTIPVATAAEASATFPTTTGNRRQAIVCMHTGSDGNIYLGIKDKFYGQDTNGSCGRVYKLDPNSGNLTEINTGGAPSATPATYLAIPYCMTYFDGRLFWGEYLPRSAVNQAASVYATSLDATYSFNDRPFAADDASIVTSMCVYDGQLWVGTGCYQNTNAGASFMAKLWQRRPGGSPSDNANWGSQTVSPTPSGDNTDGNYWSSMVVFNGDLYAVWYAPSANTQIYKIVNNNPGDPTSTSFTFTSVFNNTSNYPFALYVDDGIMYAIGVIDGSTGSSSFTTADGTNWTSRTTVFGTLSTSSRVRYVLFGLDQ